MFRNYLEEIKQFDLETTVIIIYSTFLLLLSIYFPRYKFLFPDDRFLDRLIISGLIYGIGPFLIFFIFRHKPQDFGISLGRVGLWSKEVLIFYVIMVVILLISFKFTNLKNVYPLFRRAHTGANYFVLYQVVQLFHMCTWEFFFRGFMLFGLEKKFGKASILIQTIPFAIMHFRKPHLEAYGSIFAGIFLGLVALRSRSFLPAAILHFSVALTADIIGILM
jgi:membrane protease YdiL (CAAX protease family)